MSLIITVYTSEGIIMASDSRTTYNSIGKNQSGEKEFHYGVQKTDTTYKTFLCNNKIGISTCGACTLNNRPITGYIENFINEIGKNFDSVEKVSQGLIDYFNDIEPNLNTIFLVAGYDKEKIDPVVNEVFIDSKVIKPINTAHSGAIWDGETWVATKLLQKTYISNPFGQLEELPYAGISFEYFTLQDAVNFAKYIIDVTIKTMEFQNCEKTVGGPIDLLAIKPDGAFWVARKELHA